MPPLALGSRGALVGWGAGTRDATVELVALSVPHGMGEAWVPKGSVRCADLRKEEGMADGQTISQSFSVRCTW